MKTIIFFLSLLFCFNLLAAPHADDILGFWWSPDKKTKIEVTKADKKYYGRIIAVRPEAKEKLDDKNPDKKKRTQTILGMELLRGFSFKEDRWVDGTIYDPENGKTYKCIMWFTDKDPDTLYIRGYVGMALFGRTAEFKRVKGDNPGAQQEGEPERHYLGL